MFKRILIANRGEIACRIMRSAHRLGIETVAVYSDADASALHTQRATAAVHIGASTAAESYLCIDKIVQAATESGADAIHPGYGFLSENPAFVEAVTAAGLTFIGPSADAIRAMGLKDAAKQLMEKAGVPVVPGYHGAEQSPQKLHSIADEMGYPILIKARAGGGGKGMRLVERSEDFMQALSSAQHEGQSSFGDAHVLLEKYITSPRHIEVQVLGDAHGQVVHLYERDCSLQRRHQKVIEEAPAPGMTESVRMAMTEAAVTAAKAIQYSNAGTVEFIVDGSGPLRADGFWFMEMNTRLQVEHPVTECITGLDLVELQLRVAAGEPLPFQQADIDIKGHSFEARVYAEDVPAGFLPVSGTVQHVQFDASARNDSGVQSGDTISPFYDPMIAKITVSGNNRNEALARLLNALRITHIAGTTTNLAFLQALANQAEFRAGVMDTGLIDRQLAKLAAGQEDTALHRLLGCFLIAQKQSADTENFVPHSWRLWGAGSHRVKLQVDDGFVIHRLTAEGDGAISLLLDEDDATECVRIQVQTLNASCIVYQRDNQTHTANYVMWETNGVRHLSLHHAGEVHVYRAPDPLAVATQVAANADSISAPMTGVIKAINTQVGAAVKAGDVLLVLEAMKMETTLTAPRDGVVQAVHVALEESVHDAATLITLETDIV